MCWQKGIPKGRLFPSTVFQVKSALILVTSTAFTVISGNFRVVLFTVTSTECDPMGIDEKINGVTSPVSAPSRVIIAPGGVLVTRKNPPGYSWRVKLTFVVDIGTVV